VEWRGHFLPVNNPGGDYFANEINLAPLSAPVRKTYGQHLNKPEFLQPAKMGSSKPGLLLIGAITHAKKEWEECGSFAELKVF